MYLLSLLTNSWISKGSCDTEDWSNDAENSSLHHSNKLDSITYKNSSYKF